MIALLVALTFGVAILIDHLLLRRQPLVIAAEVPKERPRIAPPFVAGFKVPDGLLYHPGHTWAAAEGPNRVRIGIDDFAAKLAGGVTRIEVPARGKWVRQGQTIIALHRDGRQLDLVSPIEGEVIDINPNIDHDPNATRTDPYGDGWLLTVSSPDAKTNFRNLLGGTLARRWMDDDAARLRALAPAMAGVTAQEGGEAVDDFVTQLPEAEWEKVAREFFLTA